MTDKRKLEMLWSYMLRKGDDVVAEYQLALHGLQRYNDTLDLYEVMRARARLDHWAVIERDLINIISDSYYERMNVDGD